MLISDKRKFAVKNEKPTEQESSIAHTPEPVMVRAPQTYSNSYQEFSAPITMHPYQGPQNLLEQ